MDKSYLLRGLTCPNCAGKIKDAVVKEKKYGTADINLMNMVLTVEKGDKNTISELQKIVDSIEDGVTVVDNSEYQKPSENVYDNSHVKVMYRVIVSIVLVIASLFFDENISLILIISAYVISGYDVVLKGLKRVRNFDFFDENLLMTIATVGALIIGERIEAVAVMVFYQIGEILQTIAVNSSKKSIQEAANIRPEFARIVDPFGQKKVVRPEEVKIGDVIEVHSGERIPLDGLMLNEEAFIDTSAITGESVPRKVKLNERVMSGSISKGSVLKLKVDALFSDSTVSRILSLLETAADKKTKTIRFITRFSKIYTPIVVFAAIFIATLVPLILGQGFEKWVYRALIFLVVSCPCALVVSVPLSFFVGLGTLSKNGILLKGASIIEQLSKIKNIIFDKTGTLTNGKFEVQKVEVLKEGEEVLKYAASLEKYSSHPIAKSISDYYGDRELLELENVKEISGKGLSAVYEEDTLCVGSYFFIKERCDIPEEYKDNRSVFVSKNNELIGRILISDKQREEAYKTIKSLQSKGIKAVIFSGDEEENVKKVASDLSVDSYKYSMLPQDKMDCALEIRDSSDGTTAFVGDGINDAPVLLASDVGIAMGGIGSDAAVESSDVVIMNDNLYSVDVAVNVSNKTLRVIRENIIFIFAVKIGVMILSVLGIANMWIAVFADVGVTILAIISSFRIRIGWNK